MAKKRQIKYAEDLYDPEDIRQVIATATNPDEEWITFDSVDAFMTHLKKMRESEIDPSEYPNPRIPPGKRH